MSDPLNTAAALPRPWAWVVVFAAVLFNAVLLAPELTVDAPSRNDNMLHLLMIHGANDAWQQGHNVVDFWIPQLDLGFPQFLYYQHLPHLSVVALHRALLGIVSLERCYHLVQYTLLVGFPLTVVWSMRRLGFSTAASALGSAAASLFSGTVGQFGFEYNSYIWSGFGLFTQLWAMHLSFLVLACASTTANEGRGYVRTAVALAALALSHLIYGGLMVVSLALIVVVGASKRTAAARVTRMAVVGGIALAITSYFWWPFLQSGYLYLSSRPDLRDIVRVGRHDFEALVHGEVFDAQRLPILTLLVALGAVFAVVRRDGARIFAVCGIGIWLFIYLDPAHGPLRMLFAEQAQRIRFRAIGPVHLFGVLLIGVAGDAIWSLSSRISSVRWRPAAFVAVLVLLLTPALLERTASYRRNTTVMRATRDAIAADRDQSDLLSAIAANRGGRTTAGPPKGWGASMRVGENALSDMLNARRMLAVGSTLQALSLNAALLPKLPTDNVALFDAYDVRTIILPANVSLVSTGLSPLFRNARYAAWRVPTSGAVGYVRVERDTIARSQRQLWNIGKAWFFGDGPRTRSVTRVHYGPLAASHESFSPRAGCLSGQIISEQVASQRVSATVNCPTASALMFKQSYHPNWRVRIDGAPTATYMVTPAFLAVDVPAGQHVVEAEYVPTASKRPLLLLGGLVLLLAVVLRRHLDLPAQRLLPN